MRFFGILWNISNVILCLTFINLYTDPSCFSSLQFCVRDYRRERVLSAASVHLKAFNWSSVILLRLQKWEKPSKALLNRLWTSHTHTQHHIPTYTHSPQKDNEIKEHNQLINNHKHYHERCELTRRTCWFHHRTLHTQNGRLTGAHLCLTSSTHL